MIVTYALLNNILLSGAVNFCFFSSYVLVYYTLTQKGNVL